MDVALEFIGRLTTTSAGHEMFGANVSWTVITTSSVSDPPPVSVTVSVMVCVPVGRLTVIIEPVPSDVAPSAHEYELIVPLPALDAEPSRFTAVVAPAHSTV